MSSLRTPVQVLLALLLLLQSFALAAAVPPQGKMAKATLEASASSEMPCHRQQADPVKATPAAKHCPCCDGDCPDMQLCAVAHVGLPSSLAFALDLPSDPAPAARVVATRSTPPTLHLRPPIVPKA